MISALSSDDVLVFGEAIEQHLPRIKQRGDALVIEGFFERFVTLVHKICATPLFNAMSHFDL